MIDEEQRPGRILGHTGDVGADLLHQRVRLQVDDVAGAFRGNEKVLVVGHHLDRADAHVTDLEAADPGESKWGHTFVLLSFGIILAQLSVSE